MNACSDAMTSSAQAFAVEATSVTWISPPTTASLPCHWLQAEVPVMLGTWTVIVISDPLTIGTATPSRVP